jgi:TonB family protein
MTRYGGCSELKQMSDRKTCIRCARAIDEFAKICPFCNWDQTMIPPPPEEVSAAPVYVPPEQKPWRNKMIGVGAFVALIIVAFVVGTLIHGFEPAEIKAAQTKNAAPVTAAPGTPAPRSNVTLVPVSGDGGVTPIEQPITTAPATAPGQQPNDATALPADQYAAAEARAKAQREAAEKTKSSMVDPRTLRGTAYEQRAAAASASAPSKPGVASNDSDNNPGASTGVDGPPTMRTSAYLQYKPLPHIPVDHNITARLSLTVDQDGHVTDIDVNEPVPDMPKVIAAVQNWRFKPATQNGQPVTSHVAVDITFRANE